MVQLLGGKRLCFEVVAIVITEHLNNHTHHILLTEVHCKMLKLALKANNDLFGMFDSVEFENSDFNHTIQDDDVDET